MTQSGDRWTAKQELVRINKELESPHILIGGLAVQKYCVFRDSRDIDLICDFPTSLELIKKLYPTGDWKVEDQNQNDYRPSFRIIHKHQEKGEIIFGPKITEREPYKYINWEDLKKEARPFSVNREDLSNILVPSAHALAYTKLISFLNRSNSEKIQQDLEDFCDLTNHDEFSATGLYSLLEKSQSRESLTKKFLESSRCYPEITNNSCPFHLGSLFSQFYGEDMELEQIKASLVPSGTIMLWSGTPDEVPRGWVLCDGENNTPDLRDRFVCGAGGNGTEAGSYGEADSHTHNIASQSIPANTNAAGNHGHRLPERWYNRDFAAVPDGAPSFFNVINQHNGIDRCGGEVRDDRVQDAGEHSHSVTVDIADITTNRASNGKPKWFALCYIMKQ